MRLSLSRYVTTVLIIIIVPQTVFPSCLLFLTPLTVSTVRLRAFYFYRLIKSKNLLYVPVNRKFGTNLSKTSSSIMLKERGSTNQGVEEHVYQFRHTGVGVGTGDDSVCSVGQSVSGLVW